MSDLSCPDAPRPVALVRDFVNTTDHETGSDDLTTPADLARYLRAEGLSTTRARATDDDLALALALRRGLRTALERNHDETAGALPELDDALAALPVRLAWGRSRVEAAPGGSGIAGALAAIGLAALQCATDGTWHRLKICSSDECEWAYYDRSKNRSRAWCEYGCGNKLKTRAYRARLKQA